MQQIEPHATQAAYGRYRGVSAKTVSDWKGKGLLVMVNGLVDVAASDKNLEARPERYRGGVTAGASGEVTGNGEEWSLAEAQRVKETYLARLRELEFQHKSGQYVEAKQVADYVGNAFRTYRNAMQNIPARHAAEMAAKLDCDPLALDREMSRVIRQTLQELSEPAVKP